jgi:Protein of unknown function (DUF2934)
MDDIEQRIRQRAYRIWEEEGRPEGRAAEHWERARFLVGIEARPDAGKQPNPIVEGREKGYTTPPPPTPVEPIEALENPGEFPDRFADQGEKSAGPMRRQRAPAAEAVPESDQPAVKAAGRKGTGSSSLTAAPSDRVATDRPAASGRRPSSRLNFLSPWRSN